MSTDPAIDRRAGLQPALRIPAHLGVIMDGNGRWAKARGKPRTEGHVAGVKALRRLVELCITLRRRAPHGVQLLLRELDAVRKTKSTSSSGCCVGLLRQTLQRLIANNVQVRIIGAREGLDERAAAADRRRRGEDRRAIPGSSCMVAFNYGGKAEITEATRQHRARGGGRPAASPRTSPRQTIERGALHRRASPIPTSSSAPAASSGSRISCSGRAPIPNWSSSRRTGPISTRTRSSRVLEEYSAARPALRRRRGAAAGDRAPTHRRPRRARRRRRWTDLGPRFVSAVVLLASPSPASISAAMSSRRWSAPSLPAAYREWERMVTLKPLTSSAAS